jgi:tagaturonate reductase
MQFGEGNFMRAFIDWQIDQLNESTQLNAGIAIIRPIDYDALPLLDTQDGLYTTIVRGVDEQGHAVEHTRIIQSVNTEIPIYREFDKFMALAENSDIQFVFSNTTEAGIEFLAHDSLTDQPAKAFPAKLTQWLLHRYQFFEGSASSGVTVIPCELIDYNGEKLKQIVLQYCELWQLSDGFIDWLNNANYFCSTLVDRIVTGFPKTEHAQLQEKLGYRDQFMVTCEYFHLFVIQGPEQLSEQLCLANSNLNIKVVDDIYPYKQRKVAILNGAHTAMVPMAYMAGIESVGEAMADTLMATFVRELIFLEIIPTLDLPKEELNSFAKDVIKRFQNPFIEHKLMSIALNSMSKFRTRLVPQLKRYHELEGKVPPMIAMAMAAQMFMYRGRRGADVIELADDERWLTNFTDLWSEVDAGIIDVNQLVHTVLAAQWHWEEDLTLIPGLVMSVADYLGAFLQNGVNDVLAQKLSLGDAN